MHALILAAAVTALQGAPGQPAPDCHAHPQITSSTTPPPVHAQTLGSLPDANEVRAVLRSVDGCSYQEVVGFNVSTHAPAPAGGLHVQGWSGTLMPDGARVIPATPTGR